MKKNRLIFLLVAVFLLTGCQTNYDLKIMFDGQVEERVVLTAPKEEIMEDFDEEEFKKMVNESLKVSGIDGSMLRNKKYIIDTDTAGVNITNNFESIDEYVAKTKFIKKYFDNIDITKDGKIITLKTEGSNTDSILEDEYINSYVNITLPYEVVSSNADTSDEDSNTYSWKIETAMKDIEISYDTSKVKKNDISFVKEYFTADIYTKIILVFLIILIVILSYIIVRRIRKVGT